MRGIRTPLSTILIPASARTASDSGGYLASGSRMKDLTRQPVSCRSMTRFRVAWVIQAAVGCAVASRTRTAAGVLDDREDVHPGSGQGHGLDEVGLHECKSLSLISCCAGQASGHERDHGDGGHGFVGVGSAFVVADQAAVAGQPAQGWTVPALVDTWISCPIHRERLEWVRHAVDLPRSTRTVL
jgi:hypothetical protein